MPPAPGRSVVARLLGVSAAIGVATALAFKAFTEVLHEGQHWLWHTVAGEHPSALVTIAIATGGGLALGLALWLVPGHGGQHPADHHGFLPSAGEDVPPWPAVGGIALIGLVGLIGGASLGPEGAVFPAAAGAGLLIAHAARLPDPTARIVQGAALSALLAAMFGNPVAGVVPLLELIPAGAVPTMAVLVLPSLTAAATTVLTQQVFGWHALISLPLEYGGFKLMHLVWAVLIGIVAGGAGLLIDRATVVLRLVTRRLDARSVVLTATVGGLVLGVLYAIGGDEVRFSGIPELLHLAANPRGAGHVLLALAVKILATAVCLAAGYRGGKIFPAAFVGGAAGLVLHLWIGSIPLSLALAVGLSAAMATALGYPVTAALNAAAILTPELLPLALLGVVAAHAVHLLADQLQPAPAAAATPATG